MDRCTGKRTARQQLRFFTTLLILAAVLLLHCGCFTTITQTYIEDSRKPSREFGEALNSTNAIYRGVCLGVVQLTGTNYFAYEFTNVLAGSHSRVLQILVAEHGSRLSRIGETNRAPGRGEPAFLFSKHPSSEYPLEYFRQYYPCEKPEQYVGRSLYAYPGGEIYLLVRSPGSSVMTWEIRSAEVALGWVARSRASYVFAPLRYAGAVLLDAALLPCYVIFFIIKGNNCP
jgi:hypothetical protein